MATVSVHPDVDAAQSQAGCAKKNWLLGAHAEAACQGHDLLVLHGCNKASSAGRTIRRVETAQVAEYSDRLFINMLGSILLIRYCKKTLKSCVVLWFLVLRVLCLVARVAPFWLLSLPGPDPAACTSSSLSMQIGSLSSCTQHRFICVVYKCMMYMGCMQYFWCSLSSRL